MKRKVYGWILLGLGILCLVSCDEGRIYEAVLAFPDGAAAKVFHILWEYDLIAGFLHQSHHLVDERCRLSLALAHGLVTRTFYYKMTADAIFFSLFL